MCARCGEAGYQIKPDLLAKYEAGKLVPPQELVEMLAEMYEEPATRDGAQAVGADRDKVVASYRAAVSAEARRRRPELAAVKDDAVLWKPEQFELDVSNAIARGLQFMAFRHTYPKREWPGLKSLTGTMPAGFELTHEAYRRVGARLTDYNRLERGITTKG